MTTTDEEPGDGVRDLGDDGRGRPCGRGNEGGLCNGGRGGEAMPLLGLGGDEGEAPTPISEGVGGGALSEVGMEHER